MMDKTFATTVGDKQCVFRVRFSGRNAQIVDVRWQSPDQPTVPPPRWPKTIPLDIVETCTACEYYTGGPGCRKISGCRYFTTVKQRRCPLGKL